METKKTYVHELAPWETKKLHHLNFNTGDLAQLKNALVAQHQSSMKNASSLIISAKMQADDKESSTAIDNLCNATVAGISSINKGIASLQATFEWGISEIVWQLELQSKQMEEIISVLKSPLQTESKEHMKWGDGLFAKEYYEMAEKEYFKSLGIYKYNPIVYISLGIIYLFHLIDKKKALENFQDAAIFAKGDDYYLAYALMYQGLTYLDLGEIELAERVSEQAIQHCNQLGILYYQNAQYNALLGNKQKSIESLCMAVEFSIAFAIKADADPLFNKIRDEVSQFLNSLIRTFTSKILKEIIAIKESVRSGNRIFFKLKDPNLKVSDPTLRIKALIIRGSLLDTLEAARLLEAISLADPLFEKSQERLKTLITQTATNKESFKRDRRANYDKKIEKIAIGISILTFISVLMLYFSESPNVFNRNIFSILLWLIGHSMIASIYAGLLVLVSMLVMKIIGFFIFLRKTKQEVELSAKLVFLEEMLVKIRRVVVPKVKVVNIPGIKAVQPTLEIDTTFKQIK